MVYGISKSKVDIFSTFIAVISLKPATAVFVYLILFYLESDLH